MALTLQDLEEFRIQWKGKKVAQVFRYAYRFTAQSVDYECCYLEGTVLL